MSNKNILIIGAGLTGLSAAHFLTKKGYEVTILEKQAQVGGVIQTQTENGFTFESGPTTGVLSNTVLENLFAELSCDLEVASETSKKRLILKNDRWHPLPYNLTSAINTPLFSWHDKFRVLGEPFRKKGSNPDETLEDFVKRRLGKTFHDFAVAPFISGVYAGNTAEIIPKYALPKLYNLEQDYGSFVRGSIQKAKENRNSKEPLPSKKVFSCKNGLTELVKSLANNPKIQIICSAQNVAIEKNSSNYTACWNKNDVENKKDFNTVISTVRGDLLEQTLPFLSEKHKTIFNNIVYAPVAQVSLGYKNWEGLDINAFGGLVPPNQKRGILGVLFPSSMFENRAPKNGALLSVFLGGQLNKNLINLSEDEIIKTAINEVKSLLCEQKEPNLVKVFKHHKAIPQYNLHIKDVFDCINEIEKKNNNLFIAGGISGGIGMADRVLQGYNTAYKI